MGVKKERPNKETMAAIAEARAGEYAGELDATSADTIMESLMRA